MCSTIIFGRSRESALAGNYDYSLGHGLIATNLRGTQKENGREPGDAAVRWTVEHGSVTLNSFALEMPVAGMNEAGLCVALMWHDIGCFGWDASVPRISGLQWIQHQLDCHASIDDVINGLAAVQPKNQGMALHYLILDAAGESLVVEFISGQPALVRNPSVPVLTNSSYVESVRQERAGELEDATMLSSLGRFRELVDAHLDLGAVAQVTTANAFAVLHSVSQGQTAADDFPWEPRDAPLDGQQSTRTVWSYVFRPAEKTIELVTMANNSTRVINLGKLDLSSAGSYQALNIHAGSGEISETFEPYSIEANRDILSASARVVPMSEADQDQLIAVVDEMYATRQMRL